VLFRRTDVLPYITLNIYNNMAPYSCLFTSIDEIEKIMKIYIEQIKVNPSAA